MTSDDGENDCNRRGLLFYLLPTTQPEPPISNQDFLQSLVSYGCWPRIVAANNNRITLCDAASTELERYAAISSFYENVGMLIEDVVSGLVIWPAWAQDRGSCLADMNERLIISDGQDHKDKSRPYREEIAESLAKKTTKRVRVNPSLYLSSVFELTDEQIVRWLGIPWKHNPSVKMVPRSGLDQWHRLPNTIGDLRRMLSENSQLIVSCYNKLKHGPQLVISSVRDALLARGDKNGHRLADTKYVRLLFDGAKTENGGELHVAPFLFHQPYCVNAVFHQCVWPLAVTYWGLASWLLCTHFTKGKPDTDYKPLRELFRESVRWERQTEWPGVGDEMPDVVKMAAVTLD